MRRDESLFILVLTQYSQIKLTTNCDKMKKRYRADRKTQTHTFSALKAELHVVFI